MNIFKGLKSNRSDSAQTRLPREMLPDLHAFVDVAINDSRRRESVSVDAIENGRLTTRLVPGLEVGATADFLYTNSTGRYRFWTVCTAIGERSAHFNLPVEVKALDTYGSKRRAVRIASMQPIQWRYTVGGLGEGAYFKGSMNNLSRIGVAVVVDRDIRDHMQIEVRLALAGVRNALCLMGEVVRADKIEKSGKTSAGIRFVDVDSAAEATLEAFIQARQIVRRDRGVV